MIARSRATGPWQPTVAHVRALIVAAAAAIGAVVAGRPDLLVIGVPFGIVAAWAAIERPRGAVTFTEQLGRDVVREGAATRLMAQIDPTDAELLVGELSAVTHIDRVPASGAVAVAGRDEPHHLDVGVRPTRWGRREIGGFRVVALGSWAAFRSIGPVSRHQLTALPLPGPFDSDVPFRPARGLVGQDRALRTGQGAEFAAVRGFRPGDRLRRINWPRTLRSDTVQVNASWADEDNHVALVLDASVEIGVDLDRDLPSSLDVAVRAAGAISEHLTRRGDRVALYVYGGARTRTVPAGTGRRHERRVLDVLAGVRTGDASRASRHPAASSSAVADASLVVMLSPLAGRDALDRAVALGRRGLSVVVIDTLPDHLAAADDPITALAWRIRLLERRREIRRIERVGVPVSKWHGPRSLDGFLRDVARRARAPRMRRP